MPMVRNDPEEIAALRVARVVDHVGQRCHGGRVSADL